MVTFRDISYDISDISDVSEIFPFIIWFLFAKKGLPYSILGYFFLVFGSIKIFTLITAELGINNMPAFHILAFLEVAAVYSFYNQLALKRIDPWVIVSIFVLYAANSLYIQNISTFNSLAWIVNMFLIMYMGLNYFLRIYKNEEDMRPLDKRPDFVITAGWLIYAAGSLFPYLMVTDLFTGKPQGFFNNGWIFQNVANLIKNCLNCYGFWLTRAE